MDYPQIVTTIMEGLAPVSSVVDAPWVTVTSINGMTGDVIVEPIIKPFQSNHYYLKDSVVTYNGAICIAKQTFTSGESFNANDWDMPDLTQEQADWNEDDSTAKSYIKNKPTIPTVNNGTLTIQKNGTDIAIFSANTATNTTANISVPTKTSEITNDSDFIKSSDLPTVNDGVLTIQKNGTTVDTFTANSATNKTVNIETITAETVAPAEEVGAITTNTIADEAVTASKIDWLSAMNKIYPVGSIYMSATMSTVAQVQTALGGTWVKWGAGRVPVGVDTSQTEFNSVGKTGGEKTHTLTVDEMPSHSHNIYFVDTTGGSVGKRDGLYYNGGWWGNTVGAPNVGNTGGGQAHNNLQPYITCYMYKRTA